MRTKAKSTFTETNILSTACERRNGHVLPLPVEADPSSPRAAKLLKSMLANGLLEERRTTSAKGAWRADLDGQRYLLRATELGRKTLGDLSRTSAATPPDVTAPVTAPEMNLPYAPRGKLGEVLSAVRSGSGASIGDLTALTGWQPHTVRASLTRLRQTGVPIQLTGEDGQKRYVAAQVPIR